MNKPLTWIILAVVVLLLLILLAVLPARQASEELPFPPSSIEGEGLATPFPTPLTTLAPTPEALTPEKEKLADLEAEVLDLAVDPTLDADLQALDGELRGI